MQLQSGLEIPKLERELLKELGYKEEAQHQAIAVLAECNKQSVKEYLKDMLEHQVFENKLDERPELLQQWNQEGSDESVDRILDLLDIKGNKAKVIARLAELEQASIKSYLQSILTYEIEYTVSESDVRAQYYLKEMFFPLLKMSA